MVKRTYPPEFKATVLHEYLERGATPVAEIAKRHKVRPGMIYAWARAATGKPDYVKKKGAKATTPRKVNKRHSVAGWMKFALIELRKDRPNTEVARAYLTLAEHAMEEEVDDG